MQAWSPWHGCHRISPGCLNCYVYRRDEQFGKDAGLVERTAAFDLPLRRDRQGAYKLRPEGGEVFTCGTSDFFLEEADPWRAEAWRLIRQRPELTFLIPTKRIHRFRVGLPGDWGEGYENVRIALTCEDQQRAGERLPVFLRLPIRHRLILHEPLLGPVDIAPYLAQGGIEAVICGGESGDFARVRPCDFAWVLHARAQCVRYGVPFRFKQTGALFRRDGVVYRLDRSHQLSQAARARIDYRRQPVDAGWTTPNPER